jgi:hypothetical protein
MVVFMLLLMLVWTGVEVAERKDVAVEVGLVEEKVAGSEDVAPVLVGEEPHSDPPSPAMAITS